MQHDSLTIGVLGMGTMGSAVAASYGRAGHRVLTDLTGRSGVSVDRAEACGLELAPNLRELAMSSDVVFSIVPPGAAVACAESFIEAVAGQDRPPLFVDANAVSVQTIARIAARFAEAGLRFVDAGIVGLPPSNDARPALYLSGPRSRDLAGLDGTAFRHRILGDEIGSASAFKMAYAGLTKGINSLLVCQLLAAERFGFLDAYLEELEESQGGLLAKARRSVPRLPADSGRWADEMLEIADTLETAGLPRNFHMGAAEIMRRLAASPFSEETRETVDQSRTLRDTIKGI